MKYKYQLDPSSKKFICPTCEKRCFVRMINDNGEYLSDEFGRCDRSNSCGYYKYPNSSDLDVIIDNKLDKLTNISLKLGPPSIIPVQYVHQSLKGYGINPFYQFLMTIFNKSEISAVFNEYKVGTSKKWGGATIFWQISKNLEVRSGKVIKFDPISGKRIKHPKPLMTWVHSLLRLNQFNLKQVLFGEHLLSQYSNKTVCLVESEKTAIIMAIKFPKFLWLATGSKQEFKIEKLKVLKDRKVIVFPDSDAHEEWKTKSNFISKQLNLNLVISTFVMNCTIALDHSIGFDLADLN